jgi:hypothetical protein
MPAYAGMTTRDDRDRDLQPRLRERLPRAGEPVDDRYDTDNVGTFGFERRRRPQRCYGANTP